MEIYPMCKQVPRKAMSHLRGPKEHLDSIMEQGGEVLEERELRDMGLKNVVKYFLLSGGRSDAVLYLEFLIRYHNKSREVPPELVSFWENGEDGEDGEDGEKKKKKKRWFPEKGRTKRSKDRIRLEVVIRVLGLCLNRKKKEKNNIRTLLAKDLRISTKDLIMYEYEVLFFTEENRKRAERRRNKRKRR